MQLKKAAIKTNIKKEHADVSSQRYKSGTPRPLQSFDLRQKLIRNVKSAQEQEFERQKNRLKKVKKGTLLGTALDPKASRSPSINSISSDDNLSDDEVVKKKKKKKSKSDLSSDDEKG